MTTNSRFQKFLRELKSADKTRMVIHLMSFSVIIFHWLLPNTLKKIVVITNSIQNQMSKGNLQNRSRANKDFFKF